MMVDAESKRKPRAAIFGEIAEHRTRGHMGVFVHDIRREALLSRLLFFDRVVINSVRLQEVPFMVKLFGLEGCRELISQDILQMSVEASTIMLDRHHGSKRELPLLQFQQSYMDVPDHSKYISDCAGCLRQISGLSNSSRESLTELIHQKIARPPASFNEDLLAQIRIDLRSNLFLLKRLIASESLKLGLDESAISLRIEETSVGVQRYETNIHDLLGTTLEQEHKILDTALRAVVNLDTRIAEIASYSAISLFETNEAPLLFGKVHGLISPHNPSFDERSFLKVVEYTEIPKFLVKGRIDTQKLLSIRQSSECIAFRNWLSDAASMDEKDLKQVITGFRAGLSGFVNSTTGKGIRFAANTALGFIPGFGTIAAIVEGIADSFLLDKLLPSSGALSFLAKSVPSIFKTPDS